MGNGDKMILTPAEARGDAFFAKMAPPAKTLQTAEITKALGGTGLGAGELGFEAPDHIIAAGVASLLSKQTKYLTPSGFFPLKAASWLKYREEFGIDYDPETQIGIRGGGKGGLTNIISSTLTKDPDAIKNGYDGRNEVIIGADQWLSYRYMLANVANIINVPTPFSQGYKMKAEDIENAITDKTKYILYADPGNPTGACHNKTELKAQAKIAKAHPGIVWLTEIMYKDYIFGGKPYNHLLKTNPKLADQIVLTDCDSKSEEMSGLRLGRIAGPKQLIKVFNGNNSHDAGNTNVTAQYMSIAGILGERFAKLALQRQMEGRPKKFFDDINCQEAIDAFNLLNVARQKKTKILEQRGQMTVEFVRKSGLEVSTPEASFYLYPSMEKLIGYRVPENATLYKGAPDSILTEINEKFGTNYKNMAEQVIHNSTDYVNYLLLHHGVGVVDGTEFKDAAPDEVVTSFRLSFAANDEVLLPALERVVAANAALGSPTPQ